MSTAQINMLTLADWRRQINTLYEAIRRNPNPSDAWCDYRASRDQLFQFHPQTPLNAQQLRQFQTIPYFPYDPAYRVMGRLETAVAQTSHDLQLPTDGLFRFKKIASVHFEIKSVPLSLDVYWIEAYGGGIFLPFRDQTNGRLTYGGGRYLYDSIKGADLNTTSSGFILDFNFAYHPSCAYNDQWVCPLAPPENKVTIAIQAGELQMPPSD